MVIQIDSREHAHAISKIKSEFNKHGVKFFVSKLHTGDYMSLDNPRIIVDRKKDLLELVMDCGVDHKRFRNELVRAQEMGIHLVILCEHGPDINDLTDVAWWQNPREWTREKIDGVWQDVHHKVLQGDWLAKTLRTMISKYGIEVQFCNKDETGRRIIEILGGE